MERKAVRSKQIHILEEELRNFQNVVADEGEFPTVQEIHERIDKLKRGGVLRQHRKSRIKL